MIDLRINHRMKSTISIKMFIEEFGENFSEHMKERLMDLEIRCFLTRKEIPHRVYLKHVEHLQYEIASEGEGSKATCCKEYVYGQLVVLDGRLYFSESCLESNEIMQSPMVNTIYSALGSEGIVSNEGKNLKRLDENNIDFVIDNILSSCPQVSQSYIDIVKGMLSRANGK